MYRFGSEFGVSQNTGHFKDAGGVIAEVMQGVGLRNQGLCIFFFFCEVLGRRGVRKGSLGPF